MSLHLVAAVAAVVSIQSTSHQIADLRDEGICNVGWLAGNSYGHPIWPQVRGFVGEGGEYYNAFVLVRAPHESERVAAQANVRLYNQCRERGENAPFNERESISRIQRAIDISEELRLLMRRM